MNEYLCNDALASAFHQNARTASMAERGFILRTYELARKLQCDAPPCTLCDGPVMTSDAVTICEGDGTRGKLFAHKLCFLQKRAEELESGRLEHRFIGEAPRG